MASGNDEITRLQSGINDLISLQALPAIWSGQEPAQIVATLLDVLVRMLRLRFAYVRVADSAPGSLIEQVQLDRVRNSTVSPGEVGRALHPWLGEEFPVLPLRAANPVGTGEISIAPLRVGLRDEAGILVAGSERTDFPTEIELLLLRAAANTATIGLQEAYLQNRQRRDAEALERGVAERTAQLTAANTELRREIIERRHAEEEQRKLTALIENSADFIGIASLDGRALFLNSAGRDMVGLEGDDHLGTVMLDYVVEEERERFQQQIVPVVMREGRWDGEIRFKHFKTNAAIPILHHMFLIHEADATVFATISRDMSERNRADETLREVHEQLARVTRVMSMGELTASIAHEVNQPLAAIVANGSACLRWLAHEVPNLEEVRGAAERIIRDGNRASDVVRRIRGFSSNTAPHKAWVDINGVIEDVLALANNEMRKQRILLRTELSAALAPVMGDRVQLQQVLLNLVMNGIEAMHPTVDRPRGLLIRSTSDGPDELCVAVQDCGIGFDPKTSERLFDAFFTTKPDGMGLGLSISRRIVEAHGGRLWAKANDDHGAIMLLALPTAGRLPT